MITNGAKGEMHQQYAANALTKWNNTLKEHLVLNPTFMHLNERQGKRN